MSDIPEMTYPVPAQTLEVEFEIKKSRFIARAGLVKNREDAMEMLASAKADYPDARHHCWAYLLGNSASAAMSDDGEPSGTAGKPILNVLQHKGVGDVMLVVTRYFGGIKLGAGGLVRAYSASAQQVMEQLPVISRVVKEELLLSCSFAQEQSVRHWLGLHDGDILDVGYGQQVDLTVEVPTGAVDGLKAFLAGIGGELIADD